MALDEFLVELEQLTDSATESLNAALDVDALEAVRIDFLGAKSGRLKTVQKGLASIDSAEKPVAGKRFNEAKKKIEVVQASF